MKNRQALIVLVILLAVATGGFAYAQRHAIEDYFRSATAPALPPAVSYQDTQTAPSPEPAPAPAPSPASPNPSPKPAPAPAPAPSPATLPATFNLAVAFTTQTPLGNWDAVHEDTCEEAAILMVDAFYKGKAALDPKATDDELLKMVDFENKLFGYYQDTTAAQTGTLAEKYFGYKTTKLIKNPTVEDIKKEVLAGHPVVVPTAGQQLHNPYFTAPGPIYHMIVIRGWTSAGFITNDPGTKHGNGFVYSESVLMSAMHDWDAASKTASGGKVVLVIYPNP